MAELKQEETQQELFPGDFSHPPKNERLPIFSKAQKPILLNTNVEQIILVVILLILALCFIFFLGILRGRSISSAKQAAAAGVVAVRAATPLSVAPDVVRPATTPGRMLTTLSVKTPELPQKNPISRALSPETGQRKPYTIQLVSYKRQDLAEKDIAYLRSKGYNSVITTSGNYFNVSSGQYNNKDEAKADLKFLSALYKGCYLRRR